MNRQLPEPEPVPRRSKRHGPALEPDGIEAGALFAALWRSKWLILAFILISWALTFSVLRTVRPSYYSFVEVLLNTRQERVVGIEQVVSDLTVTNSVVAGEIAVLRSNLLLGQVVDDLDLMQHPDFDPYKIAEPGLFQRAADVVLVQLGLSEKPSEPMPDTSGDVETGLSDQDARNIVIWQVRRNLSVYQSGISYVISISMQAHDPDIAAAIANAVAERYIQDQLGAKLAATQRAIAWLDNRLIELETQLRDAEDVVVEFLAEQVLEEGGDKASVAQQLTEMNRAIVAARNDRAAAEARLDHVRRLMAEGGPEAAAAALSTSRLTSLDAELANLDRQRAQLATRLGPRHPEMLSLQLAIDDLLLDRVAAIRAGVSELEAAVAQALGRERAIREDIGIAQLLQVDLSRSSVRLSQLERSASAMRQVYESFLARFQETTQQLEFQRPDARIITDAQSALSPARPRTKLILAVALTLGAILGIVAALVREALDRSVRTARELSQLTGLPVLGTLPRVRFRGKGVGWQREQLWLQRISGYAEGLRLLRFGLMNPPAGAPPRIVMLTGADWGAGASTTVLGLGRAMAAIGLRVVIVDANFRHPDQAQFLGQQPTGPDTDDYLNGAATGEDITLVEVEPRLSLVPAIRSAGRAADILSAPRFRTLIDGLAERHDMVLIDAPPATGLADTTVLARLAEAVVVVVRSRQSRESTVVAAIDALEDAGGLVVGTVLSHTDDGATTSAAVPTQLGRGARQTEWHADA
jgi:uncharacterized protein involved in exopolysaccharide biosynthesis/MinD-like ATPase involved in chromosome partitioning or flagellar assembly